MPTIYKKAGPAFKRMIVPMEIKEVTDQGLVRGYASIFGNVDLGGDVISKDEPFKEFATNQEGKILHLFQHDSFGRTEAGGLPIGLATVEQNSKGLKYESQLIMEDPFVKTRVYPHMKAKTFTGMSIGYDILPGGAEILKSGVRQINAMKLWEISSVTFGMNPEAGVDSVKGIERCSSVRELEDLLRDAAGLSRAQAKRHAGEIWKTVSGQRDAGEDEDQVGETVKSLTAFFEGKTTNQS